MQHTTFQISEDMWIDSGTEDELSAPSKLPRVTPRNSAAGHDLAPYANSQHLAGRVQSPPTPHRRASSVRANKACLNAVGGLSAQSRTPGARPPLQPSLTTRSNPATLNAIRVLQQRKATPGRDRRKSGRMQRETPRNNLRNLSKILALTSQRSPPPLPLEQDEPSPIESSSSSIDSVPELKLTNFSIVTEDQVGEDDDFWLALSRLSMPIDMGEQTRRSIETGRRALHDQNLLRSSQGSFEPVRESSRFEDLSAMGLNGVSQPPFDDSLLQNVPHADEEYLGVVGKCSNSDDEIERLRHAMHKDYGRRQDCLNGIQQARKIEGGVHSSFVLNISELQSRRSSAEVTNENEQQPGGFNEEPEQDPVDVRPTNSKATIKARRTARESMKKSHRGFPYPSFPARVTKRIASTFARSLGGKSTSIDKETLKAISEATEQYFGQLSNDLGVFANHAGRKKIVENDVIAVMKRQRQVSATMTPFSLAEKYLPGELLQGIKLPAARLGGLKRRRPPTIIEQDGRESGE